MITKKKMLNELDDKLSDIRWALEDLEYLVNHEIPSEYSEVPMIYDIDKFIRELNSANLYSKEMEEFIANYLRYSNQVPD